MDNRQAPLVEEANAAAAECGDDCRTSELVASESDEPESGSSDSDATNSLVRKFPCSVEIRSDLRSLRTSTEHGNLEEPDPEVLSFPKS